MFMSFHHGDLFFNTVAKLNDFLAFFVFFLSSPSFRFKKGADGVGVLVLVYQCISVPCKFIASKIVW